MILLDTHVLVHYALGDKKVGRLAHTAIDRVTARGELFVSAISFWEIAMLGGKGRLKLKEPPSAFRTATLGEGIRELPVDGEIAIAAGELPATHSDPADRLIVATAMTRDLRLVTADDVLLSWRMRGYQVQDETS